MKCLLVTVLFGAGLSCLAATAPTNVGQIVSRETGGYLVTTHKKSNEIFVINAQKRADERLIKEAFGKVSSSLKTPIGYEMGSFSFPNPVIRGELSLYIIDDSKMPMSLVAPEGRWAFVNVSPLAAGEGEKPQFFAARTKKEIIRLCGILFGGIGSTYRDNVMAPIRKAEDLDTCDSESLPADFLLSCSGFLRNLNVKPFRRTTYRRACEEGWAPAPTNDVQKAVWDKVHAIPKNPMKIEFDPKTGR